MPSYDRALHALRTWLDFWAGIGHVAVGMARQGSDLQLTPYDEEGRRATFYTTGMEPTRPLALGTLKAAVVRSCGFALFLGACAITNTPQQELAYARWAKCNAPYVSLERVDLDGRITFKISNEGSRQQVLQCLAEAGRTGPPLPEPVGVYPPSGP
jgi:hypothetical protein